MPPTTRRDETADVESALRRENEELRSFIENASLGLHWVGPDGIIQWANAADYRTLGYAREEYVGQHISKFHADRQVIEDILVRLGRGERLVEREARLRCKDGTLRTVIIDSCVLWRDGKFVHTQCFTRDVTRQRQAERASQHLAALVESCEDAIMSQDLRGTILTWNRAAERLYGWAAHEMVGRQIWTLIPDGLRSQEELILARIVAGERVENFETVRRRKDGVLVDVSLTISPIVSEDGRVSGVSRIVRDITERKRAQAAIRRAEEENRHLAEIIESADVAIMGVDLTGRINAWNRGARKLFGYAKSEILGKPLSILAPPEAHEEVSGVIARLRDGGPGRPYEAVRLRKNGSNVRVSITVWPVRSGEGTVVGGSAMLRPVAESGG